MKDLVKVFNCPIEVFYLSVSLLDRYLDKSSQFLILVDLHEIGVTCAFIASKFIEQDALTLKLMHKTASHGKVSEKQIKAREILILNVLKFRVSAPTLKDCVEALLGKFTHFYSGVRNYEEEVRSYCEKYMMIACLNYRFSFSMKPT